MKWQLSNAWHLLLLPILAIFDQSRANTTEGKTTRYTRSADPQDFQTNFDPISAEEVRNHFVQDTGLTFQGNGERSQFGQFQRQRTQQSSTSDSVPKRTSLFQEIQLQNRGQSVTQSFRSKGNNQELLPIENFPEEHLANRQDPVLNDFLRIQPKSIGNPTVRSRENNPRSFPRINATPTQSSTQPLQAKGLLAAKPITNPLLQKLFNRKSIPFVNTPSPILSKASIGKSEPLETSPDTLSLFEKIKNRINDGRRKNTNTEAKEVPTKQNGISRAQTTLLRDQVLIQKQQQDQEILKILNSDQQRIQIDKKKKEFEQLLAEKREKEKLLMEALIMQREQRDKLKEAAELEKRKIEAENKRKELEQQRKKNTPVLEVTGRAKAAVQRIRTTGGEKSSPAVWAAVKALSQFVSGQADKERDVPQDILMAIIQLTDFLDADRDPENERKQNISAQQKRLREQILRQRQQKEQEIANILNAETVESFMQKEQPTTTPPSFEVKKVGAQDPFPDRITVENRKQEAGQSSQLSGGNVGNQFAFSTLPVL